MFIYIVICWISFFLVKHQTYSLIYLAFFISLITVLICFIGGYIFQKIKNHILQQERKYENILLHAEHELLKIKDLKELLKCTTNVLLSAKINILAIFIWNEDDKKFNAEYTKTQNFSQNIVSFSRIHPVIRYLNENSPMIISLNDIIISPISNVKRMHLLQEIQLFFYNFGIHLIIPLVVNKKLIGFLILGKKKYGGGFTHHEKQILRIFADHVSLALENCLSFNLFRKEQEKISCAEKLASVSGMADGVAHQVKNRLNQFSIVSGELKYEINEFMKKNTTLLEKNIQLRKTFEYFSHIADSLVLNVKKTNTIIGGILQYARTESEEINFSHFSLNEILSLCLNNLKSKHEISSIPLEIDTTTETIFDSPPDIVYGIKSQIMEVIYNILDNAFEAVETKKIYLSNNEKNRFETIVKLRISHQHDRYILEIYDNGIGIQNEHKQKVFAPFFTTKSSCKSESGIGMYIVKRIVEENHKGKIWFHSIFMQETKFFIELPRENKQLK